MWQNLTFKPLERQLTETELDNDENGHCRRVFEDEIYRENLVNDAVSALRSGNRNICLMALRSLYIDVKQAITASSDGLASDLLLSSWSLRPTVCRETSGCISVNLGPAI
ncbi:uncharacterized protein PITG_11162 [Phytophthora infestans T30-4]|uniref:Uncharacterized protein n=1 Tax=Phytophthora infestans (strain T30-4) TaxID=403677 RepID=D0NGB8_PHYIT|nr:uncharacterized protein PITG_11162 [Phytophthora infestans T30-4]EEY57319.1 hypothetical protein PITG_11162 [Phytophthora infestans T30-4]|eukprot:XP_002901929.1 hypothetical protein PITG_11162 [Phytophthora infestans T30-4]